MVPVVVGACELGRICTTADEVVDVMTLAVDVTGANDWVLMPVLDSMEEDRSELAGPDKFPAALVSREDSRASVAEDVVSQS